MEINDPFFKTLIYSAFSGFLGIFFGLILGLIIVGTGFIFTFGEKAFDFSDMVPALMFCMGVGSVVGAVLGGLAVLRSSK